MPIKELIAHELEHNGEFCTLGVVGHARGVDISKIDPGDRDAVAKVFGIAPALAAEIVFMNDEGAPEFEWGEVEICGPMRAQYPYREKHSRWVHAPVTSVAQKRWHFMRNWVNSNLRKGETE